ncbi:hypothetical protein RHGRI_031621 [Rhododendron griersonianum]|uniref:Integrase catalytic domain-containing protein n=1 Tax=Rhododendron griersonianum TaxID=479676 RepID=A0AAV6IBN7_9ERIC|nr:hypothetical protein RHGRI_031621 [Rhododendron griersonianum]
MDLVGPIRPGSRKNRWILAATEVYTKWVEAVPLKKATGDAVAAFIKENIICRFGIPKVILSDNGTPFINHHVGSLLDEYTVDHRTSSAYYPRGNGQAEATNKTLIRILSKLLDERGGCFNSNRGGCYMVAVEVSHCPTCLMGKVSSDKTDGGGDDAFNTFFSETWAGN